MAKKNKNQMVASEELVSNAPLKDADLSSKNVSAKAKDSKEFKNKKDKKQSPGARIRKAFKEKEDGVGIRYRNCRGAFLPCYYIRI